MKIMHTADLHLGSPFAYLTGEKRKERKAEHRKLFHKLAEYARKEGIGIILLAGDVFDEDRVDKNDKNFFYETIRKYPEIDFLYLRGNHDLESGAGDDPPNLKRFSDEWKYYRYNEAGKRDNLGNIVIAGLEISKRNIDKRYHGLLLDPEQYNIVLLHGDTDSKSADESSSPLFIDLKELRNRNIDYLALGHIHSFREGTIDGRGKYVYPGCPEGRGFDETGEKGFVLLDTETNRFEWIPFGKQRFWKTETDIGDTESLDEALEKIEKTLKDIPRDAFIKIEVSGKVPYDYDNLLLHLENEYGDDFACVEYKINVRRKIPSEELIKEKSFRGEFVRVIQKKDLSEEQKQILLEMGLEYIEGEKKR